MLTVNILETIRLVARVILTAISACVRGSRNTVPVTEDQPSVDSAADIQNGCLCCAHDSTIVFRKPSSPQLINQICSKPVNRFKVNDGTNSAIVDQPQFLPRFYFTHELEYSDDQFDSKAEAHIQDVAVHMNFEINIKTVWEFKNPRIDPIV